MQNAEHKTVTPVQVEKRLVELSKEIDEAHKFLEQSEMDYYTIKSNCEINLAEERLAIAKSGMKFTVQEKEDMALTSCAEIVRQLAVCEAKVKAARGNAARIRIQVDIARSVGTSVRSSMEL